MHGDEMAATQKLCTRRTAEDHVWEVVLRCHSLTMSKTRFHLAALTHLQPRPAISPEYISQPPTWTAAGSSLASCSITPWPLTCHLRLCVGHLSSLLFSLALACLLPACIWETTVFAQVCVVVGFNLTLVTAAYWNLFFSWILKF